MKTAVGSISRVITVGSVLKIACSFIIFGSGLCRKIVCGYFSNFGLGSVLQQKIINQPKQALYNKFRHKRGYATGRALRARLC